MSSTSLELRTGYMVLLLLLAEGPKHGYELIKRMRELFEAIGSKTARPGPGSVYPILKRLEEEGLIESSRVTRGARELVVYRITSKGVERLLELGSIALDMVNLVLSLHVEAAKKLPTVGLSAAAWARLREIAGKLANVKLKAEELIKLVEELLASRGGGEGDWG